MTIAIDFDGVIHDQRPRPGYKMGQPLPGAKEAIDSLIASGHEVLIHTVRANTTPGAEAVGKWLDYFNIPGVIWDEIGKPNADIYLDDRATRFTDWSSFMEGL